MSYYDQWFLTNQQQDSTGKRKRNDFYSDGGKYSSDYLKDGRSAGGQGSSYRGGASERGRRSYNSNRGVRGRGGFGAANPSDFHQEGIWQRFSNTNFVSKKQRMDEISQLGDDTEELMLQERLRALREEKKKREMGLSIPYSPGPPYMRQGGYGRDKGFGGLSNNDYGWGYGPGPYRGRVSGRGYHSERVGQFNIGRGESWFNRGRGESWHRHKNKKTVKESEEKKERELEENNPYEYKLDNEEEVDIEGRDQRLLTLMKLIKSFAFRSSPAQTLRHCIRNNNLNIQVYYYKNKSVLFLDQLFIARGTKGNQKSDAYTQAINKLKTFTLDEIKAEAEKADEYNVYPEKKNYPAHTMEEMKTITTPIELAEFPFRKRLELFCLAINRHDPNISCTKLYCTKYAMNLRSVYTHHPEEEEVNRHQIRIYLCEMFVSKAQARDRSKCDKLCINNFYEALKTKTVDELMENDERYSKDFLQPPKSIMYKGVGHQEETNLSRLASLGEGTLEEVEKNDADDVVIIEKKSYEGSWCKILEESACYSRLKLTYVWDLVHPGGVLPEIGQEKKLEFEAERIGEGRKSRKKGVKTKADLEEDKIFADKYEIDDIKKHKEAVAQRARAHRVMMINCKIFLQDKFVGEGYSTYRRCALQVASVITYKNLFSKHSAIFHHDDVKHEKQEFEYPYIIQKAEKLQEELTQPPVFEEFNQSSFGANTTFCDPVEKHDDNDDENNDNHDKRSDENELSDDDDDSKIENENNTTTKRKTKDDDECQASAHERELEPWIKEVVRRDLEKLANSDVLWEGHIVYSGYPVYIYKFFRFYSKKYGIDVRSRMEKGKKTGVIFTKTTPRAKDMVEMLMKNANRCSNRYTLEQRHEPDGNLVVYNNLVKKSSSKLPKQNPDNVEYEVKVEKK